MGSSVLYVSDYYITLFCNHLIYKAYILSESKYLNTQSTTTATNYNNIFG